MTEQYWDELKNRRVESGKTLEEINKKTKIGLDILEKIESGDFSDIPETYMRLFIKSYGNEIGVDYQEMLENSPYVLNNDSIYALKNENKKSKKTFNRNKPQLSSNAKPLYIFITLIIFLFVIYIGKQVVQTGEPETEVSIIDTFSTTVVEVVPSDTAKTDSNFVSVADRNMVVSLSDLTFTFPVKMTLLPTDNIIYRLQIKEEYPREELIQKNITHNLNLEKAFVLLIHDADKCQFAIENTIIPTLNFNKMKITMSDSGKVTIENI